MVLGFGGTQQTAWEKADVAVEDLLKAARVLHQTVEPDPANMGILGAGSIGTKAESVRQCINKLTKAMLNCAAEEPDGKMKTEETESILKRIEKDSPLLVDVLKRMGAVHYHRFCELGMGIPTIVKTALGWIESSTKECFDAVDKINKSDALIILPKRETPSIYPFLCFVTIFYLLLSVQSLAMFKLYKFKGYRQPCRGHPYTEE